jgi:carbohydrate-binding DOMON domain-containing protein
VLHFEVEGMRSFVSMAFLSSIFISLPALADSFSLKDPANDDNGPGTYTYPTDAVYKPGSFDMTAVEIEDKGSDVVFKVTIRAKVEDPWNSKDWQGNGFSIQFPQIYIDTDHKAGSGFCDGLPGTNVKFKADSCWEKVVLVSPQPRTRLDSEVSMKASKMKAGVVIPTSTRVAGKTLVATVKASDLGGTPKKGWGFQVVMQSNEGYPDSKDLLSRKVNEIGGQHRFGGGSDYNCDPHVIDMLAGAGKGEASEVAAQHAALKFSCNADNPDASPKVELPMVYP